ncbi:MAG: GDP-L-fucose synthase [Candidatus Omnitrophica bacterium]|nr:GDP-L-fucose synthase [Candidatus Omnitrophota bacterium]
MNPESRIYVAGRKTLIGAALLRRLKAGGYTRVIEPSPDPDAGDPRQVDRFFETARPDYVFCAAGRSGGILANQKYPADLMRDNLLSACHLLESARRHGTKKLLYLASSCSYPKHASQPMKVESLLTGPLEATNEGYAVAKIAGLTLCRAYRRQYGVKFVCGIPGDPFGPGDDFDPEDSHVVAALIRKIHEAKEAQAGSATLWGTGAPRRGFIYADDLAEACIFVMLRYDGSEPINIAGDWDLSIRELAEAIRDVVGFQGTLFFDSSKPDGCPVKVLDSSPLFGMGWRPTGKLHEALKATYDWFLEKTDAPSARISS